MSNILSLSEVGEKDVGTVGVNAALLGELQRRGYSVTNGFVIPSHMIYIITFLYKLWKGRNQDYSAIAKDFLEEVFLAADKLGSSKFTISPSVVTEKFEAYSSLAVFSSYEVKGETLLEAVHERINHFWNTKALLDNGTQHEYINESIDLALILQEHREGEAVISYTYEQDKDAVYFEYGDSVAELRRGHYCAQKLVMGNENKALTSLLLNSDNRKSFEEIQTLHNEVSDLLSSPIEICWNISETPLITQIRVVKEEVKAFSI